jgi:hypothetical protein
MVRAGVVVDSAGVDLERAGAITVIAEYQAAAALIERGPGGADEDLSAFA